MDINNLPEDLRNCSRYLVFKQILEEKQKEQSEKK